MRLLQTQNLDKCKSSEDVIEDGYKMDSSKYILSKRYMSNGQLSDHNSKLIKRASKIRKESLTSKLHWGLAAKLNETP